MAADLMTEVPRFREWGNAYLPEQRFGEWELDYPHWDELYEAVLNFIAANLPQSWTAVQVEGSLYAIARDNEAEYLAEEIRKHYPEILYQLAAESLQYGERDAKWQLAVQLGALGKVDPEVEGLLLKMVGDPDEYVRRRALKALAQVGSPQVEALALAAWHRPDANQQWTRMAALWSLHRIQSPLLEGLLAVAEADPRPYLSEYAKRIRRGEVEL